MKELEYPFNSTALLNNKKKLRRLMLENIEKTAGGVRLSV